MAYKEIFNIIDYQRNINRTAIRYHLITLILVWRHTLVWMAYIKKTSNNNCWYVVNMEPSFFVGDNISSSYSIKKSKMSFHKTLFLGILQQLQYGYNLKIQWQMNGYIPNAILSTAVWLKLEFYNIKWNKSAGKY